MQKLEEAVNILENAVSPIREKEQVALMEAAGRILADDITAPADQPPFPRSPLDGYAVRGADTLYASEEHPVILKVLGKIYAGEIFQGNVEEGQCVRLMTGAPIPQGADTIVRQEHTDYGEERVNIYQGSAPYQSYCHAGEDYHKGDVLLKKGDILNGVRIGVAAGAGAEQVAVYREPVITVISTGDEVVAPGERLPPGKIYDSNRYLVTGRLQELGLKQLYSRHCEDDIMAMCGRIREAAGYSDLIITTGGVSVGERDIMHQVMECLEGKELFWRVDLKPGAPTLAFIFENVLVICLTGNPYGAAVNFELLIRPVVKKLTGNPRWQSRRRRCILGNDSPKHGGVRRFLRGYVREDAGEAVQILAGSHASGTLSSMSSCNCLVEIAENGSGKAGESVWVYPL